MRTRETSTVVSFALGVLVASPLAAHAQGFLNPGGGGLDPKFCENKALRQTVVYVDDMMMRDGATGWANTLFDKLKATLVPGERVSVVELSPTDGQSHETWTGCWPDYSAEGRQKLAAGYSFFSRDPLKAVGDQQKLFAHAFGSALASIYDAHHRPDVTIDAQNPPHKAIVSALSSDGARYAQTQVTVRAVVYSDLAENSDIGSVFRPLPKPPVNYGRKLGTFLRSSVFYAFGVDSDVHGGDDMQAMTRDFWTAALGSMSTTIGGFGSDLNIPNALPVAAYDYTVDLKASGQPLTGRLSLLVDADGGLVDSWIGISRLSSAAVNGTMKCGVSGSTTCMVNATTAHGIVTDSPSEALILRGSTDKPLSGTIGVTGSELKIAVVATPTTER